MVVSVLPAYLVVASGFAPLVLGLAAGLHEGGLQLATAFGVHRALDAAGAAAGPVLAFTLLWALPRRYDVVFFSSFVIALVGLAALVLLVDERAQPVAHALAGRRVWAEGFALFGDMPLRQLLVLAAAFGVVTISDAFIYLLLVQRSHASAV